MIILFPLLGFWFWISVLVSLSWLSVAVYRDLYTWATIDLILVSVLWSVTGHLPIFGIWHTIQTQPLMIVGWAAGYLVAGIVWATVKWKLVLRKLKRKFDEWYKPAVERRDQTVARHEELLRERKESGKSSVDDLRLPPELSIPSNLISRGLTLVDGKGKVDVGHYRTRIIGWVTYWWASILLWLLGDFLADVGEQIYRVVKQFFQKMADSEFQ